MTLSDSRVPDRGPSVFIVTTTTLALAFLFVVARLVSRSGNVRYLGWDDYTIILAWVLAFGVSFTIDLATKIGFGKHDANILEEDVASLRRYEYAFSVLYVRGSIYAKLSSSFKTKILT